MKKQLMNINNYATLALPVYQWFTSDSGYRLYLAEQQLIEQILYEMKGQWLCLTGFSEINLPIKHKIPDILSLGSLPIIGNNLRSDIHFWPIKCQSMDVVLLHHVLEWSEYKCVLSESSRVLCADGMMIIVNFNPFSFYSICRFLGFGMPKIMRKATFCSARKIVKELRNYGFVCNSSKFYGITAPLSTPNFHRKKWLEKMPIGSVFVIVAQKKRQGSVLSQDKNQDEKESFVVNPSYAKQHVY